MGGYHNRSGLFEKEKNLFSLPGIQPRLFACPSRSLGTIPTELSWFAVLIVLALYLIEEEMSTSCTQAFEIP
jgi:hypothetical protein